jgi:hypothetical protein
MCNTSDVPGHLDVAIHRTHEYKPYVGYSGGFIRVFLRHGDCGANLLLDS